MYYIKYVCVCVYVCVYICYKCTIYLHTELFFPPRLQAINHLNLILLWQRDSGGARREAG